MTDLNKLYYEINKIYPLILISLGTLGNTFTFFIYTRAELNKTTTAFYFSCSALIDTLALYFEMLLIIFTYFSFLWIFFLIEIGWMLKFELWTVNKTDPFLMKLTIHKTLPKWETHLQQWTSNWLMQWLKLLIEKS